MICNEKITSVGTHDQIQRKLVSVYIWDVTKHRASICCPYRKRIREEIGTRLTLERSRDVIRECSRTTFISPPLLLQHVWSRHLVQMHTQLTYPFRAGSPCVSATFRFKIVRNTPIFIIDTFPYKIVKKKKKKKNSYSTNCTREIAHFPYAYAPFSNYILFESRSSLLARFNFVHSYD